jgi:hypothetical protein
MMSRGPQVADMEYREENEQTRAPIIPHITISINGNNIHHTQLGPQRKKVLLHEVTSYDIMVSVILIFEAFEHVAKDPFLILKTFAWKLCLFPYFTLVSVMVS